MVAPGYWLVTISHAGSRISVRRCVLQLHHASRKTRYLRNALIGFRYVYGSDLAFAANSPAGQDYKLAD